MDIEKAKQVINNLILTKTKDNEIYIVDKLQVGIACRILQDQLTDREIFEYFNPEYKHIPEADFQTFKEVYNG